MTTDNLFTVACMQGLFLLALLVFVPLLTCVVCTLVADGKLLRSRVGRLEQGLEKLEQDLEEACVPCRCPACSQPPGGDAGDEDSI